MIKPLYPCLWYDGNAKEAADYYCSIFKSSKIISENPMVVTFELNGFKFMGLNGGPHYKFSPATSFVVECDTQEEIDYYWEKLSEGGDPKAQQCGWLKDKFGLSWQIVPESMDEMMTNDERSERVMKAMFPMKKLDMQKLEDAFNGK